MPKIVEIPGHGEVEFPDSMSDLDISLAARRLHDSASAADPKAAMRVGGDKPSALKMAGRHPIPAPPGGAQEPSPDWAYWRDERAKYSKLPAAVRAATGAGTAATRLAAGVAGMLLPEIPGFTDKQGKDTLALMDYEQHGDLPSASGGVATDTAASFLPLTRGASLATRGIRALGGAAKAVPGLGSIGALTQFAAPVAGDAAALAGYNFATTPGDLATRTAAAKAGAGAAAVASALTRTLARVANPGITATPEAQALMDRGVPLTPGYLSPEGSFLRSIEERAQSMPIVGPAIRQARAESLRQWNRADVERVMGKGGYGAGTEAVTNAVEENLNRYNELLGGHHIQVDPQFLQELEALKSKYLTPEMLITGDREALEAAIGQLRSALGRKVYPAQKRVGAFERDLPAQEVYEGVPGASWKRGVESPLRQRSTEAWNSAQTTYGEAINELREAVRNLRDRNIGEAAAAAVRENDARYAELLTRERAGTSTAGARENGFYSPSNLDAAAFRRDNGPNKRTYQRGEVPGLDAVDEALPVFKNSIPDVGPGTAEKMQAAQLITGGVGSLGYGATTGDWSTAAKFAAGSLAGPYLLKKLLTTPGGLGYLSGTLPGQRVTASILRGSAPLLGREVPELYSEWSASNRRKKEDESAP